MNMEMWLHIYFGTKEDAGNAIGFIEEMNEIDGIDAKFFDISGHLIRYYLKVDGDDLTKYNAVTSLKNLMIKKGYDREKELKGYLTIHFESAPKNQEEFYRNKYDYEPLSSDNEWNRLVSIYEDRTEMCLVFNTI